MNIASDRLDTCHHTCGVQVHQKVEVGGGNLGVGPESADCHAGGGRDSELGR